MPKTSILIIEDDKAIRNLITTTVQTNHYTAYTAHTGEEAIHQALSLQPDIFILDLGLPDMDGLAIIQKVRSWTNKPIIVVSARGEDESKIEALSLGLTII